MHKLVEDMPVDWEDINHSIFENIVKFVGPHWTVFEPHTNSKKSGWCLTFDDGCSSDYEIAFPILHNYKASAIFFLIIEKIGQKDYLNWSQIVEMHQYGMTFGSHSLSHQSMTRLSKKQVIQEFSRSKCILEEKLGAEVVSFSYPYGDYSRQLNKIGIDIGYQFLFTSEHGIATQSKAVLPRNSIHSGMSWNDVMKVLNASLATRFHWSLEDNAKGLVKMCLGRNSYTYLRDKILRE
tara:strand:+ start:149 stop:859 length:711 start_codon:yes stop_codon:yes gene_type:complete